MGRGPEFALKEERKVPSRVHLESLSGRDWCYITITVATGGAPHDLSRLNLSGDEGRSHRYHDL